ncbi:hypothetical protein ACLE20_15190 [Rhizobium sp. YIM 134829]|uniref:hypothetical protein n=1 Tax=Rhizobium sp. YIM 134829 TaxID=3390453 RepID=UPI00397E262A
MTNVKMVALDTVHITSVSKDNLTAGAQFEIDSATAKDLESRGIAKRVDETASATTLREDGPTISEFVAAGYDPSTYPPAGYASRSTDQEIADAIAQAGAAASKAEVPPQNKMEPAPTNKSEDPAVAAAATPASTSAPRSRRQKA